MSVELLAEPQPRIPVQLRDVQQAPQAELARRIRAAKAKLGGRLMILGHHYQKDEIIQFADVRGDSYGLSVKAAETKGVEYVIFCGVHFMAETADVLTEPQVEVILPDLGAGCSMADMADIDQVEACWEELDEIYGDADAEFTPVTYINSTAALKAFCGKHGGIVCTSSNAEQVLKWALERRPRVLFFPDQHLGRNTAKRMGIALDKMHVWDPRLPEGSRGGNQEAALKDAKVVLWRGWCSVHQMFTPAHVKMFRDRDPETKILVHPECQMEVVDMADYVGSTGYIIRIVREAPKGSKWAVGTELHLVNRLRQEFPDKEVRFLSSMVCMCATMYRIDLPHLCWAIENLVHGVVVNRIEVAADDRRDAILALERMLAIKIPG
ncbi:MAG TPA: quinolinate synthase NadA [Planctomycetia bacterium]|nr:quinolinate synthase NadA [Planctomycetia bacterium]